VRRFLGFGAKDGAHAASDSGTPPPRETKEQRPKGPHRGRLSTAPTIEDGWTALGGLAQRSRGHAPLGRYLQWQAPAAGEMLDDAVKGTMVDRRILQPVVKARGRLDLVVAVMGPPAVILAIEQNPARAPALVPLLRTAIRSSLPTMLPAMKKAQAREAKVDDAVREMFPDLPPDVDPVDLVISQLFEGYDFTAQQPPPAEAHVPADEPVGV